MTPLYIKSHMCIQSICKYLRSSFLRKYKLLTIFAKSSILDLRLVLECASESSYFNSATSKHDCLRQMNHCQINSYKKKNKKKCYKNNTIGNKAKGRISKQVFQEKKARQIFRKTNILYPLIRTRTCAYQGVQNVRFSENLACFLLLKHPF